MVDDMRCCVDPDDRCRIFFSFDEREPTKKDHDFLAMFDYDENSKIEEIELRVAIAVATINNTLISSFDW